jgi:hypothetical protein
VPIEVLFPDFGSMAAGDLHRAPRPLLSGNPYRHLYPTGAVSSPMRGDLRFSPDMQVPNVYVRYDRGTCLRNYRRARRTPA